MARRAIGKGRRRRIRRPLPAAVSAPARRFLRRAWARWALLGLTLLAVGASVWLFVLYPRERGPGRGHVLQVVITRSLSAKELAAMLADGGLVSHPNLFAWWVRATGGTHRVVQGAHWLSDDASPRQLMARLERRPGGGSVRVTFPEGWTRFDMARRLQDKNVVSIRDFLDATTDTTLLEELGINGDSAEGFLFPATYDFSLDDDASDVVRRMKREFDRRWDIVSRAHSATLTDVMSSANLDVRDIVTLASLVERETGLDDERPIVASVFLNRLRDPTFKPKHLQCDPTAAYGCLAFPEKASSCAAFAGKPTAAIEHDPDNPYSTYTHEGLPPGPIANPGIKALDAVAAPSSTHYFYFVARGDGHHAFSETYEAHVGAVHAADRIKR